MQKKFADCEFQTPYMCTSGGVLDCVAVAITPDGVGVRSTNDRSKTTLRFTHTEWDNFIKAVRDGSFSIK